jgi:hypothetical protein
MNTAKWGVDFACVTYKKEAVKQHCTVFSNRSIDQINPSCRGREVRSPGRRSWRPGWHPSSLAWCAWRPVRCSTSAHGTSRRASMGSRRLRRAPQQQPCYNRSPFFCCCVWVSSFLSSRKQEQWASDS